MNGEILNKVTEHKHLGLTLSDNGKWNAIYHHIWIKHGKESVFYVSFKYLLNRNALERMYFTLIRPLLEYCDVIWSNCTNELKHDIEAVQIEAARIVTGATKLCSIDKLYNDIKWNTLETRRSKHKLILFYKMKNNLTPQYLSELIPSNTQLRYQLRNASDIPHIPCRTQLYSASFLPSTIREWNNLPDAFRNASSLSSFKLNWIKTIPNRPRFIILVQERNRYFTPALDYRVAP